nr:MAG: hypothetical protein [Apis mellifera filamentous virus]WOK43704.1 MAG: hypothetical protein [Apis mellifera filamentous virus]
MRPDQPDQPDRNPIDSPPHITISTNFTASRHHTITLSYHHTTIILHYAPL